MAIVSAFFLGRKERVEKDSILPSLGHVAAGAECIRSHDHQRRTRSPNLQINESIVGAACTCWEVRTICCQLHTAPWPPFHFLEC